jgi:hypothetical protein
MEPWLLAVIFKPLACALVAFLICAPVRWLAIKLIPEGKLKRLLLWRIPE